MNDNLIEWVGYIASFLVVLSFVFKKMEHLRIVSAIGCALFVLYGYFIDAIPVVVTNLFILLINMYFIFKSKRILSNTN